MTQPHLALPRTPPSPPQVLELSFLGLSCQKHHLYPHLTPTSHGLLSSPSSLCLANSCTSCRARLSGHLLQEGCPTWTQSLHVPPQHRNPGLPPPLPRPVSGHTLPRSQDPTLPGTPGTLTPQTHELSQKQPALDCGAWAPSLVSLVLSA